MSLGTHSGIESCTPSGIESCTPSVIESCTLRSSGEQEFRISVSTARFENRKVSQFWKSFFLKGMTFRKALSHGLFQGTKQKSLHFVHIKTRVLSRIYTPLLIKQLRTMALYAQRELLPSSPSDLLPSSPSYRDAWRLQSRPFCSQAVEPI